MGWGRGTVLGRRGGWGGGERGVFLGLVCAAKNTPIRRTLLRKWLVSRRLERGGDRDQEQGWEGALPLPWQA